MEQGAAVAGCAGGIAAQLQQAFHNAPMSALGSHVQCVRPIQIINRKDVRTRLGPEYSLSHDNSYSRDGHSHSQSDGNKSACDL